MRNIKAEYKATEYRKEIWNRAEGRVFFSIIVKKNAYLFWDPTSREW